MSFFVYFNSESNKFNFVQGDGQLQMNDGKPIVKTIRHYLMGIMGTHFATSFPRESRESRRDFE